MTRVSPRKNKRSSQLSNKGSGQIRIIAGLWRGRKLKVLDSEGLRPTTDRMKETLFNWLMPYIHQANCLDLFAGSGSLSFEALSRQAQHVTLIERDKVTASQLRQNIQTLKLEPEQASLINQDALLWLQKPSPLKYDIVFIDPPFNQGLVAPVCQQLDTQQCLNNNALIYIEQEINAPSFIFPSHWLPLKRKVVGQVETLLYQSVIMENITND